MIIPDTYLIGEVDRAWMQATGELAYERSGPERFLETIFVLYELYKVLNLNNYDYFEDIC